MNFANTEKCYYTRGVELISQERDGKKSYYVYDGHGSVRALADESGKVTDKYVYDAFGNLISSVGSTKNDFLFAGEQFDPVTGLYYLRARYMNPTVGTFISMDSYDGSIDDPVSLHKYLYANANPVSNSDPSGYKNVMEFQVTTGIQGIINKIAMPNPKALLDMVGGIFDVGRDVISTIKDGKEKNLDTAEIAINVAAGLITSLVTNFSCLITSFQPPVGYILMGVAAIVVGIIAVYNFSQGNTGMGIAQVINLVSIIFSMFNPTCFTGDTEVYTSDGLVCIEEISVGDEVLAYDYETGETELKEVLNVWVKETDEILHVSTSDGETIDTTTNHPFYVEEKGWVAAGDLDVGDILITADGSKVEITELELENLAEPISVYNLEVADFHTYFVGEYGVLVHNTYKVARNCSKAEAEAIEAAQNLVPGMHNGSPTRGAKWVFDLSGKYQATGLGKGHEKTVIFSMKDGFMDWVNSNTAVSEFGKEIEHMGDIIRKSAEPGAMGIGVNLLDEFKKFISKIEIK